MTRITSILAVVAIVFSSAKGEAPSEPKNTVGGAAPVELCNERVTLKLGKAERGAIVSLVDRSRQVEFIAQQAAPQLFRLAFSKKADVGDKLFCLSSQDAKGFSVDVEHGVATLRYDGLGDWPVQVTCKADVSGQDTFVRWRLSVQIPESLVLEEVRFPLVSLCAPLGERAEDDVAVFGHTKGGVIRNPAGMKIGSRVYGQQPGSLAAQFGCYYDDLGGFYLAAYDAKGYPKNFEMERTANGVEMDWKLPCFSTKSYAMDFDVVMTTFADSDPERPTDWRDAADIYKIWALRKPWCATTYAERTDIPSWMKDGPAMVRFSRSWLADPARIDKWVKEYWKENFPNAPLITAYWGWEKVASWVTPDYFPVYPSDEQFTDLVARLRPLGCHAFPWPSGYRWTLTYDKQDDGTFSWNDRERFEQIGRAHAVHERNGQPFIQNLRWLKGGSSAFLCPGDPWTMRWFNEDICAPLARRGCEMIQVDQVVGGKFPFCYSPEHGHPPGPGLWMTEVFTEQLKTMRTTMQQIEPDSVICYEEPNERFNHLVGIQDYRDCERRSEWASIFNYLYHEFLPTFQSNPVANDRVMAAYCLINGQMPHLRPSPRDIQETVLTNGGFEQYTVGSETFVGWDQVHSYRGRQWKGRAFRDDTERHGGGSSLRVENMTDDDVVEVSQNVQVTKEVGSSAAKKTYRIGAWLKTGRMIQPNGVNFCFLAPGVKVVGHGGRLPFPAADTGWSHVAADFTVPKGAHLLRIMIHINGQAQAWVDDVTLKEVLPDGTTKEARYAAITDEGQFMRRWVELYHGEGRPWLQFGRMLHPPKLVCATLTYRDWKTHREWKMPAVLHNAFRASDGTEAVVLANASPERQTATLSWKGKDFPLILEPGSVVLQR